MNEVYFIKQYTLVHILEGSGIIQVDFENYSDWNDKVIYLNKGQYIKFMSEDFVVRFIEFPDEIMFKSKDVRVLFKHLVSLGYIHFEACEDCQKFLSSTVFNSEVNSLIDVSTHQWYWQNPFQATRDEYQVIFDIKDVIDTEFSNQINATKLSNHFSNLDLDIRYLIKDKLGISVRHLIHKKQLDEDKKQLAFTDKSIKEIAYEQGFKDPGYFNRFFKNKVGQTPKEFRDNFDFYHRDQFLQGLLELIQLFHKEQHTLSFYADKLHMSVNTLSKKVSQKMNISLGKLIRNEIILSAQKMLSQNTSVKETAYALGFEEANNFSAFFSKYTGVSPSSFGQ
jgi:AraC-like DNA-binding protein